MSQVNSITDLLEAGLKAEGLRQKALSRNVANLETPRYKTVDVKFEQLLAKALENGGEIDTDSLLGEVFEPRQTPVSSNGNDVSLENEIGKMVKNSLKHTAYVRLLNKKFQQIEEAIDTSR